MFEKKCPDLSHPATFFRSFCFYINNRHNNCHCKLYISVEKATHHPGGRLLRQFHADMFGYKTGNTLNNCTFHYFKCLIELQECTGLERTITGTGLEFIVPGKEGSKICIIWNLCSLYTDSSACRAQSYGEHMKYMRGGTSISSVHYIFLIILLSMQHIRYNTRI